MDDRARGGRGARRARADHACAVGLRKEHAMRRPGVLRVASVLGRVRHRRSSYPSTVSSAATALTQGTAAIDIVRSRHPEVEYGPEAVDVEGAEVRSRQAAGRGHEAGGGARGSGWIVLPKYSAGKPTTIERLPKAQPLIAMADQSFNYNLLGAKGLRRVSRSWCGAATATRLEYSDLDDRPATACSPDRRLITSHATDRRRRRRSVVPTRPQATRATLRTLSPTEFTRVIDAAAMRGCSDGCFATPRLTHSRRTPRPG